MSKKPEVSSRQAERNLNEQVGYSGLQQAQNPFTSQQAYVQAPPDYYQLSYLKRSDEGALWERHTEYFPTHDDSTARALSLSASGATCVRTLPRYWMG